MLTLNDSIAQSVIIDGLIDFSEAMNPDLSLGEIMSGRMRRAEKRNSMRSSDAAGDESNVRVGRMERTDIMSYVLLPRMPQLTVSLSPSTI